MQPDLDRALRDARAALADPDSARENSAVERFLGALPRRTPVSRAALLATVVAVTLALALAAFAAGVSPTREPALQQAAPVRVVDRTFSCIPARPYPGARLREFGLAVTKRTRSTVPPEHWSPASIVLDGGSPSNARSKFVIVRGHESRYALRSYGLNGPGHGGAYVNRNSCVASSKPVLLSSRGLPGPPVRYETGTGCTVPGRILVRVRATLTVPTRWQEIDRLFSGVQRNVTEMSIAVRAERTGRPLIFAHARASSTVLWRADSCR